MTRDYRRWLVPKGNTFCPSGAAIAQLVEHLRKEKWICDPASASFRDLRFDGAPLAAKTGGFAKRAIEVATPRNAAAGWERMPLPLEAAWIDDLDRSDLALRWPVHPGASWKWSDATLRYPLDRAPEVSAAYDLEIHRSEEFVYPISGCIDALVADCSCGEDLGFEWDDDEIHSPFGATTGIFAECSECSRTFDPSHLEAEVRDPLTGRKTSMRGGAAYRFALVVDCGAAFPENGPLPAFHADLKTLFETDFGRDFYEIGAID